MSLELWIKAAKLGSVEAHFSLANMYNSGEGVEEDIEKGIHYMKLAAMKGHEEARHTLGQIEEHNGDMDRAMKHFVIAARSGHDEALKKVGEVYKSGYVTKDEYASALRLYQNIRNEMKSKQRTIAEQS